MKKNDIINEALRMTGTTETEEPDPLSEEGYDVMDAIIDAVGFPRELVRSTRKKVKSRIVEPKQLGDGK